MLNIVSINLEKYGCATNNLYYEGTTPTNQSCSMFVHLYSISIIHQIPQSDDSSPAPATESEHTDRVTRDVIDEPISISHKQEGKKKERGEQKEEDPPTRLW